MRDQNPKDLRSPSAPSWWSYGYMSAEWDYLRCRKDKIGGKSMAQSSVLNAWFQSLSSGSKFVGCLFSAIDLTAALCGNSWRLHDSRPYQCHENKVVSSVYASALCINDLWDEYQICWACAAWLHAQGSTLVVNHWHFFIFNHTPAA